MMYPARVPLIETPAGRREDRDWGYQPEPCQQAGRPMGARGKGRYPDANPPPHLE